jgi:hypothetical protein
MIRKPKKRPRPLNGLEEPLEKEKHHFAASVYVFVHSE